MEYPFCFSIVYHGLIAGHTRKSQLEIVNILLQGKLAGATSVSESGNIYTPDMKKEEISKYVNGRDCVPDEKVAKVLSSRDDMPRRIRELSFDSDMEYVVSAFHTKVTLQSRLNKTEKERFENIIFVDNDWVKYISEAILVALPYSASTDSLMTTELKNSLHSLHLQPDVKNLFRLSINEQIHYQIEKEIPEEITDDILRDFWRRVKKAEQENPGCVSVRAYKALTELKPKEAKTLLLVSSVFLIHRQTKKYVILNTLDFESKMLNLWLHSPMRFISVLQDCGIVRHDSFKYKELASDVGPIVLANKDYDLGIRAYAVNDDVKFYDFEVFELTETGNELINILDLNPGNDFLMAAAYALNVEYGEGLEFTVVPITKEIFDHRGSEPDRSKNLLCGFNIGDVTTKAVETNTDIAMELLGAKRGKGYWEL